MKIFHFTILITIQGSSFQTHVSTKSLRRFQAVTFQHVPDVLEGDARLLGAPENSLTVDLPWSQRIDFRKIHTFS